MMGQNELKRKLAKAAIMVACALLPALSLAAEKPGAATAPTNAAPFVQGSGNRVYVVRGNVFVAQGKNPKHRVIGNEVIVSNTLISTDKNSAALLKFEDNQIVTMQANSAFRVREYRYDAKKIENSNIIFSMLKGGMRFVTGLIGQGKKQAFRLATPSATLGIRGTEFMVTMSGKAMYSQVLSGSIVMTNAGGTTVLGAGQTAVVASPLKLGILVAASAIPSGIFSELLSIPVSPETIPLAAPALVPTPVPAPAPVPAEAPEPAKTADKEIMGTENNSGMALTGKFGTLGYGAELNLNISDGVNARFGINGGNYKYNANAGSTNYYFDLQLQSVSALLDWYPYNTGFHASGGLLYNNTKNIFAPTTSSYLLGNTLYTTTGTGSNVLSSFKGTMSFLPVSPYIGIGWGNPVEKGKGWGLVTDIGVLFQGEPTIDLVVTCATSCPSLQTDAAAENAKLQSDLSNYKWWPVVSIGITYQW